MTLSPRMCSVHTHSTLCDGKASPEAMAAAAYDAGVRYFGVSCHSHTPIPDDEGAVLPADMTDYRAAVLALREQYAGRMEVLLGLEWDSQSDISPDGFDYWIGSVPLSKGTRRRLLRRGLGRGAVFRLPGPHVRRRTPWRWRRDISGTLPG